MHRSLASLLIVLILLSTTAYADSGFSVQAKGAVLIDADTGRVLFAQNADEMLPMASTTKIMTALIALEHGTLSDVVEAPEAACGIPGTSVYLTAGERLTLEQLLYGLMLRSGNDAAAAIGIHIAGSQEAFVDMMNAKARELGVDAEFANPHGLDAEGHRASAAALANIMREAMKHEEFLNITGTQKKIIPWEGNEYSRVLYNKNRLLTSYEGTVGGKTGYTKKAGRCLVFAAERNGMTLIGCVLNCSTWFDTAERMLDYGFENFIAKRPYEKGEVVEYVGVEGGREEKVGVMTETDVVFPLGIDEDYYISMDLKKAAAPVKTGETAGILNVRIGQDTVASVKLIYADSVDKNDLHGALHRIMSLWPSHF